MKRKLGLLIIILGIIICKEAFSMNISLDTVKIYKEVQPGQRIEKFITVVLTSDKIKEEKVNVKFGDWIYDDVEQKVKTLPPNTNPNSCVSWINISPKNFVLTQDNKRVKVLCSITVPEKLDYPEYHAAIYFATKPPIKNKKNSVAIAVEARLTIIVKLTVKGKAKISGEVKSFDVLKNDDDQCYDIVYDVKNNGNVILFVEGTLNVIDSDGNLYGRSTLPRTPVSPGVTQKIMHSWYGELEPGEYDFVATLEVGSKENIVVKEKHLKIE